MRDSEGFQIIYWKWDFFPTKFQFLRFVFGFIFTWSLIFVNAPWILNSRKMSCIISIYIPRSAASSKSKQYHRLLLLWVILTENKNRRLPREQPTDGFNTHNQFMQIDCISFCIWIGLEGNLLAPRTQDIYKNLMNVSKEGKKRKKDEKWTKKTIQKGRTNKTLRKLSSVLVRIFFHW